MEPAAAAAAASGGGPTTAARRGALLALLLLVLRPAIAAFMPPAAPAAAAAAASSRSRPSRVVLQMGGKWQRDPGVMQGVAELVKGFQERQHQQTESVDRYLQVRGVCCAVWEDRLVVRVADGRERGGVLASWWGDDGRP